MTHHRAEGAIWAGLQLEGSDMSEWQPIETAPKDAELLLLYDEQEGVRAGFWDAVEISPAGWIATETQGLTCGRMEPTHWMPLPDPPREGVLRSKVETGEYDRW